MSKFCRVYYYYYYYYYYYLHKPISAPHTHKSRLSTVNRDSFMFQFIRSIHCFNVHLLGQRLVKSLVGWIIDFNGITTHVGIFYASRFENSIKIPLANKNIYPSIYLSIYLSQFVSINLQHSLYVYIYIYIYGWISYKLMSNLGTENKNYNKWNHSEIILCVNYP